jgi:probable HAF family extracellular repeat protein
MGIGNRAAMLRIGMATVASGALALAAATALTGTAGAATTGAAAKVAPRVADTPPADGYQFVTLGSHLDRTFNQLLGINNEGVIAGYFGSGAKGHPNKGFEIVPPYGQREILSENFPHAVQTQVTGLNDNGVTVGFFSKQNTASMANNNFGWYAIGGHFHEVNFFTGTPSNPPVDQLLGVNDHNVAVGFFTNMSNMNRGYTYNIDTKTFNRVLVPGAPGLGPSLTATAINNRGDVAGFYSPSSGVTDSFLKLANGHFTKFAISGAQMTQAFGVNDSDWVVGTATFSGGVTHGFLWHPGTGFVLNIDDPNGVGATVLNGINDENDLVGFYTDGAGNTDGLVAFPGF